MDKLFIDTNIFEAKGFNFDSRNILINILLNNVKNQKYEYHNFSVIDSEIISHIKSKCLEKEKLLNKNFKWINKLLDKKVIEENCYKNLYDYENFKREIGAINCDASKINPEKILKKYFEIEMPFEEKKDKRNEFPDAFIAEYLNSLKIEENEHIYLITNDNGLKKSLDKSIIVYDSIEDFLTSINGIDLETYLKVKMLIQDNKKDIVFNLFKLLDIRSGGLDEDDISVEYIELSDEFELEILNDDSNEIFVNCIYKNITLNGEFSCLDYENSYWPNDEDYYVYMEYIKAAQLNYENYEINFKIKLEDNKIEYDNVYSIKIDYQTMKKNQIERYNLLDSDEM